MMKSLKKNIPRVTGNKWNIQKFHALLHLGLDIILFGSPLMFDAARPESHHQTVCKEPARKCQKTHKNWTKKVGKKLEEERAWSSFRDMMGLTGEEPETQHTTDSIKQRSTKYAVYINHTTGRIVSKWKTKTDMTCFGKNRYLLNYLVKQYNLDESTRKLSCFTECLLPVDQDEANVVRCHPNYQGSGPWNDWGMIRFQGRHHPAKFMVFIDCGNEDIDAIVEVADTTNPVNDSVLTKSWSFPLMNEEFNGTRYHRIKVRQYLRPCFVALCRRNTNLSN